MQYTTIVADPPWPFGDKLPGPKRGAAKHYNLLSRAEIESFLTDNNIEVADNARLFLWRVASMQQEALDVMKAWGFTLKSEIVWKKLTPTGKRWFGMGRQVRAEHEVCLIGTRGKIETLDKGVRSVFEAVAGRHSAKPDEFYDIVERLSPGPYLELFARQHHPDWDAIGEELECQPTTTSSTPSRRSGSATSSQPDTSPPEMLTSETSDLSSQTISGDTTSAISSPVSASGVTPYDKQDGPTIATSGLEVAHASPSVPLESEPEPQMSGTSGPNSSVSSASAILQSSLVNRFRARTASLGSSLFKLTWKERAMPSGRSIPALRGSAHRTSGNACTSLPTPSGTSNHGKNHVAGRLDEWGGSSNPFRGTDLGRLHLPSFECWMMGLPAAWQQLTPTATLSSRRSRPK